MKKNNILFVHPIKEFSGSLKSMEEYLKLHKKKFNLFFLVPRGIASKRLEKYGVVIKVHGLVKFDNSQLGYYRGLRWILILRELFLIFPTFFAAYSIKKKIKHIDLIHFNEITLIPTIYIFKLFFSVPFILHCRILFKKNNYFGKKIIRFIKTNVNQIIAIDNDVKNSFPKYLNIKIIRNIFLPQGRKKYKRYFRNKFLNIGYIGSFLKYKGLEDLIKVFNKLNSQNYKIRLYLAGNFLKSHKIFELFKLSNNIDKNLIKSKNIIYMGHINKIDNFYNKIDVLCFPSYLNALGRQTFEAAFYKVPSIVCLKNNKSDSFINNKTGLAFKIAGSKKQLEQKIKFYLLNKKYVIKMGLNAKKLISKNYDINMNYNNLLNIYFKNIKNFKALK